MIPKRGAAMTREQGSNPTIEQDSSALASDQRQGTEKGAQELGAKIA